MRVRVGTVEELEERGRLLTKVDAHGVCVFWHDGRAYAVDDRCPHMGFPLHRGTVEGGLLTCHWHHARFDLASGGTLDPWADDVRSYPVVVEGGEVWVEVPDGRGDRRAYLLGRLAEGLEQGLTLVVAKAVTGLLELGVPAADIVRAGVEFGTDNRREGWGAGLTVLVAMANLLPDLDRADHPLALVHGLAFVARDTRNHAPRFPLAPLPASAPAERLAAWYRQFVEVRSADAAERALTTAVAAGHPLEMVAATMTAAATDHPWLDGGHTLDFTNKAFEALDHLGAGAAARVLPTVVSQTVFASRAEDESAWRHPHDLVALGADTIGRLPELVAKGADAAGAFTDADAERLAWDLLADEPADVLAALEGALAGGATAEQAARAVAAAAGLRLTRFHTQNDHGDWDVVHHGFTTANAVHQLVVRHPSPDLLRGVVHGALKVWLDRFLNVPAARLPKTPADGTRPSLDELAPCWEEQGGVDRAGAVVYGWLAGGGDVAAAVAALGHALLAEDAQFHWFQTVEAAARHVRAWPTGSDVAHLVLAGAARFLAAHTPTRRELPHVVRIAGRLNRGEELFAEA